MLKILKQTKKMRFFINMLKERMKERMKERRQIAKLKQKKRKLRNPS
jgi:hypothetical protein